MKTLFAFVSQIARLIRDQECPFCRTEEDENPDCNGHQLFDMPSDDAVETLNGLIREARELVK